MLLRIRFDGRSSILLTAGYLTPAGRQQTLRTPCELAPIVPGTRSDRQDVLDLSRPIGISYMDLSETAPELWHQLL